MLPGGLVERDETVRKVSVRETREEVGLAVTVPFWLSGIVSGGETAFEALLPVPAESGGMDLDQETVWQIVITVAVVALFVAALVVLSQAFVEEVTVENEPASGEIDGEFDGEFDGDSVTGTFSGEFDGEFEGDNLTKDIEADVSGDVEGTTADGAMSGTFEGTVSGPMDGTITGEIENGTLDADEGTLSGDLSGTINGTTEEVSPDGGVALVALIGVFIVAMPLVGYLIRQRTHEE